MAKSSGIAVESGTVAEVQTQSASGRPVGSEAQLRWLVGAIHRKNADGTAKYPNGPTYEQLVSEYPTPITKGSLQAKLSNLRGWCKEKGVKFPEITRANRVSKEVDVDALARELNLERITDAPAPAAEAETA